MNIISERHIREYAERHPAARAALQEWTKKVKQSQWRNFADVRSTFNSADYIGNQRYVFNVKGNDYRVVVVIKFTPKFVLMKFIGTHAEYDRIDCLTVDMFGNE